MGEVVILLRPNWDFDIDDTRERKIECGGNDALPYELEGGIYGTYRRRVIDGDEFRNSSVPFGFPWLI